MHKKMYFGIELECAYKPSQTANKKIIQRGSKEQPRPVSKYWYAQVDGSINNAQNFPYTVELTTRPFTKQEFLKVWTDLTRNVFGNNKLKTSIEINKSCGSHIHVSITDNRIPRHKNPYQDNRLLRYADYRKETDGSFTKIPLTYNKILRIRKEMLAILPARMKERYFRSYAKKITQRNLHNLNNRYAEWNKRGEMFLPTHAEFRSPAFVGVRTWIELRDLYLKTFNILEKHLIRQPIDESNKRSFKIPNSLNENRKVVITLKDDVFSHKDVVKLNIRPIEWEEWEITNLDIIRTLEERNRARERPARVVRTGDLTRTTTRTSGE